MRLPSPTLSRADELAEFDIWITPSLGEITDTERFNDEVTLVTEIFEALGLATNQFAAVESCEPKAIAATLATLLDVIRNPVFTAWERDGVGRDWREVADYFSAEDRGGR